MIAERTPASRLLLVDGLAGAYRFFYAIRGLATAGGKPTNAVFGFVRMMQQLLGAWKPTHCAVVFDGGIPPMRLALVPGYKANRKPMPVELREQLPVLNEYLAAAAIAAVRLDDCEADDVIATLAARASQTGGEVLIATADKDLFQLVNEQVRIVSLAGEPTVMDGKAVEAKTGVAPVLIPDWLALTGDSADNIRGVPGIGPKTAAMLLGKSGGLVELYARLDAVESPRLRQVLADNRDTVTRNLKMVRLDCAVDGVPDWSGMQRVSEPVRPLLDFYRRYELHAFANALAAPELF
jgi:DNA polymerase-1